MNRLQKKCFLASAMFHLLLAAILVVGPAFFTSKSKQDNVQILAFVPSTLVDAAISGGGNPKAALPPPAPVPHVVEPAALPKSEKARDPDPPPKDVVKQKTPDPESLEHIKDSKPRRPDVSTTPVKRTNPKLTAKQTPEVDPRIQQLADARRRAANQLKRAADSIREDASPATTIEDSRGPGGGGPSYANYAAWVKTKYDNAWIAPEDAASDEAVAKVSVTIASDGTVMSASITRPSGDSQVDKSVRAALDRVTFIAPFPHGAKEKQRTYIINFNLKAKRAIG